MKKKTVIMLLSLFFAFTNKIEAHAKDKTIAKKLWEISEEATGVKWNI